jgi:TonB family protein
MSITKLQASLAGTLLAAGLGTGVLMTQKNRDLTAETNHLAKATLRLDAAERENNRLQKLHSALAGSVEQEKIAAASLHAELAAANANAARKAKPLSGWSAPSTVLASAPVLEPGSLDIQPVPIDQQRPKYPRKYQKIGREGDVLVDFVVGTDGSVINPSAISSSDKAFELSAVEAVSQWLFQPGQKDGNLVNTHMQVPVVYRR